MVAFGLPITSLYIPKGLLLARIRWEGFSKKRLNEYVGGPLYKVLHTLPMKFYFLFTVTFLLYSDNINFKIGIDVLR
ncbi:hypothetical protein [Tenacibaculum haliotis]|uniref:hypothetical protein n=1 Tax=Tenacibaculum haliotis TaxID=1888914 RepID=UPI0021AFDD3C|nr:hypothetical protein [Tenacibaculum haliotis]MCT4697694.1 hypothetical protein [Tenacibaculum haliotis]